MVNAFGQGKRIPEFPGRRPGTLAFYECPPDHFWRLLLVAAPGYAVASVFMKMVATAQGYPAFLIIFWS